METNNSQVAQVATNAPVQFNFFDKDQFQVMQRVSMMFANSELVPDMYRIDMTPDKDGKPKNPVEKATANCMIAIEMAQRIGASALMIMQNMTPIYGRPAWSSQFLIATVNTCGRFNPLQYRFTNLGKVGKITITEYTKTWVEGTNGKKGYYKNEAKSVEFDGTQIDNLQCVCFTTARGSSELLESSEISMKMAIEEGWYTKAGSKWKTMARQMLMYRSAAFWTRAYAPELSMGMRTEDEIRDIIDVDYEEVPNVEQRVEQEKAQNANKKTISLDDEPAKQPETQPEPQQEDKQAQPQGETAPQAAQQPAAKVGEAGGLFAGTAADAKKAAEQRQRGF